MCATARGPIVGTAGKYDPTFHTLHPNRNEITTEKPWILRGRAYTGSLDSDGVLIAEDSVDDAITRAAEAIDRSAGES